ncbi:hypothetical protein [Desulfolithobacter sp.]
MKTVCQPLVILFCAVIGFALLTPSVYRIRSAYFHETISRIGELPPPVARLLTMEYRGVMADLLFLKTISFMGLKIGEHGQPTREEWQRIYEMLQLITELDPRFWDPYLFAEMMFPWQAGMFDETTILLEKAIRHRPDDYRPYYFLGFNAFYFQKEPAVAARYLRKAAQYPDAPAYIKGLAGRFSLYGEQTALGIAFLSDLLQNTSDPRIKSYLGKRLEALKRIFFLEQKVRAYREKYGTMPASLKELVDTGLVTEIPADPYGGQFVLLKNGRIYTTSNLVDKQKKKKK